MIKNFDYYDEDNLRKALGLMGVALKYEEVISSTMDISFANKRGESLLVLAEHQTAGRGRYNNVWLDNKYESILMTIVEENSRINEIPVNLLAHLVAMHVCLALRSATNSQEIKIKWPNDIVLSGKKIAGIMIEKTEEIIRIGIGINIFSNSVHGAVSLSGKGIKFDRQEILLDIMKKWHMLKVEIESGKFENKFSNYEKTWKHNSFILHKRIMLSLKGFVLVGMVTESFLGGNITVISNNNNFSISENDYAPGSLIIT